MPLDAVLIATPGSHAQPAIAAARAGLHVFVEKPMCFSPAEGRAMIAAARDAGVTLMVGNMKRYDPAVERLAAELVATTGLRLVQVTTLEAPFRPYVLHMPLAVPGDDLDVDGLAMAIERVGCRARRGAPRAWGRDQVRLSGHPPRHAHPRAEPPAALPRRADGYPACPCHPRGGDDRARVRCVSAVLTWVDLPGITRYRQELEFYAPDRRLRLLFPSPFLRNAPTELVIEGGAGRVRARGRRTSVVGYEEAFKIELIEFADSIAEHRAPRTTAEDGLADVELCVEMIEAMTQSVRSLSAKVEG